jgi:DeoR/GlpR family transcriptional regulator of sugar metabolism
MTKTAVNAKPYDDALLSSHELDAAPRIGDGQRGLYIRTKIKLQNLTKIEIARHVAKMYVSDLDAVLLDAGSTAELIAEELFSQRKFLTVMTNNMGAYAAYTRAMTPTDEKRTQQVIRYENDLILPGGRYDATYEALFGDETLKAIQNFSPNITIIGASGLRFNEGIYSHGVEDVRVKKLLWAIPADTRLIAIDSSKFGKRDAFSFGKKVDELCVGTRKAVVVTNRPPNDATSEEHREYDETIKQMKKANIFVDELDIPEV